MAINPVTGANSTAVAGETGESAFNAAVDQAKEGEMTPELEEMMVEGAITVGGQMILMPRANDILNEAMSDE